MAEANGSDRISLSRETLRAELAQMELRLVDRLTNALAAKADSSVVDQLETRIGSLELSRAQRENMPSELADIARRLTKIELTDAGTQGERDYRRWLLPGFISLVGAAWWIPVLFGH